VPFGGLFAAELQAGKTLRGGFITLRLPHEGRRDGRLQAGYVRRLEVSNTTSSYHQSPLEERAQHFAQCQ
jgi:hypothetical protein